jgi:hypothetical protein
MTITKVAMQAQIDAHVRTIEELRASLVKARECYRALQTKLCEKIAHKNTKERKPTYVAPSVPEAELKRRAAVRVAMAIAKRKALKTGKTVAV